MRLRNSNLSTRITLGALLLVTVGAFGLMFIEDAWLREAWLNERRVQIEESGHLEQQRLKQVVEGLRRDALFLSNTPPISGIIRATHNNGLDARYNNSTAVWQDRLQQIFTAFSNAHPEYEQLRYIGLADGGRELVRVDRRDGRIVVSSPEQLQQKGDRDYFKAGLTLPPGGTHLSAIDCNQENGKVEHPCRLTVRALTPVFDEQGRQFGMVVINLRAEEVLKSVVQGLPSGVQPCIADANGVYLVRSGEQGPEVPETPGEPGEMQREFPTLAALFEARTSPSLSLHEVMMQGGRSYLAARRIVYDPDTPSGFLMRAYRLPAAVVAQQVPRIPAAHIAGGMLALFLAGGLVLLLLRRTFRPLKQLANVADDIANGNYDFHLPAKDGSEIGHLVNAFETMLDRLLRREQEVLQLNAGLEDRVEERTAELHEANAQLERIVMRNYTLMQNSMEGIHILDIDGNVVEANAAFCNMLGYTSTEILGMNVADWDAQWTAAELRGRVKAFIGKNGMFESVHRRKDGSLLDVEICVAGVEIDGQSFLFAASRDITERKKAQANLERHNLVIETAMDGFWMVSFDGVLEEANEAYAKMIGYTVQELVGMRISDLEANENPRDIEAHIKRIMDRGRDRFETRHRRKDGNVIDVEVAVTCMPLSRKLFVFCRDITQRKQTELALRVAATAFETHDAIVITDAQSNIIRVNRAFTEITGYRPEEVLGKNPSIMASGRQDRAFYIEMWQQLTHAGMWSGEVWDKRKNGEVYPKWLTITAVKNGHGETAQYVGIFSDITERKRAEEEIRTLAFYDPLTHLPNRRLFLERLRAALPASARRDDYGALMFLDMDKFKLLNDTLGHDYGDLMLVEVAKRIKSCVREMDTVARLGGDEFTVLIESISSNAEEAANKAVTVAEKIREALAQPYHLKDREYHSTPSIGITLFQGTAEPMEVLLKHADLAMYQAKGGGRNAVRFFDPVMQENAERRDELLDDLRHAVERGELRLYYQVQVDGNQCPVGAEALLRWQHPSRGLVMPGEFIPAAIESDLIVSIDRWVLNEACTQLARWQKDERMRELELVVNISASHFAEPDFVDQVANTVTRHGIEPSRLKLELTESVVMGDLNGAVEKVRALRAIGVSLSMDDFDTIYSSLYYLKQLVSDQIKIHRDLVQGLGSGGEDANLVQAIVDLARNMELEVHAEGVETEEQLDFLKRYGCSAYQGYLFGKPLPPEEFKALMTELKRCGEA